jgi:hypothetical protein
MKSNTSFYHQKILTPDEIKEKVTVNLKSLSLLLEGEKDFFLELISQIKNVGKDMGDYYYSQENINAIIWEKFPNLNKYKNGFDLLDHTSNISDYIVGDYHEFTESIIDSYIFEVDKNQLIGDVNINSIED